MGYVSQDVTEEPPNQPNPSFAVIKDEKNVISLVVFGNVFNYVVERAIRFFRSFSVIILSIVVYDLNNDEKLFDIYSRGKENIFLELQDRLIEKNWDNYDFKFVVKLGTANRTSTTRKIARRPIGITQSRGTRSEMKMPFLSSVKPSPVMVKSRKLSNLKRRETDEVDLSPITPVKKKEKEEKTEEELQEEILKSLTDAPLNEDERSILKEILKHPKRKVQSNHIKKKTGLDQEVIRATLRNLVNKNILRVSSGWYILKKSISTPLSSKSAQIQGNRPVVRSEARLRRLKAQIEAESFGEREDDNDDLYPENSNKKIRKNDSDNGNPFSEETEFYTPVTNDDDIGSLSTSSRRKRSSRSNEFDDDSENDDSDDSGVGFESFDEEF
ncbi:MAG: hypothetical protein HeimC3_20360 [Candidatus Heimdallarchaeota archaeon LC_3]|nr:MAG: hypothetical protein HeimC3_20360 [Candidatus Heimdallarchaeota archaeon LC_3]